MPHARTRRAIATGAALAAALALVACGDDDDADTAPDPGTGAEEPADDPADPGDPADPATADGPRIASFDYADMTVSVGEDVTVTNEDDVPHSLSAADGDFDSGIVEPGDTGSFTAPDEAGDYEVICRVHPTMSGTLTVS